MQAEGSTQERLDQIVAHLPRGWDFEQDLLVLCGRGWEEDSKLLLENGQERVFVWLPGGAGADGLHPRARVLRSERDILQETMALTGALPQRLNVRRSSDPALPAGFDQALAKRLEDAIRSKRLQMRTVGLLGMTWLSQSLANLGHVARHPSIAALRGRFAKKPCVLVSPGPSLDKNIALLAELKGKALIVSGTHVMGALQKAGVTPDILMAADAGDLERHLVDVDLTGVSACAVAATCRDAMFRLDVPHTFTFAGNGQADHWIYEQVGESARLETGGSVACSAFSLALELGCDPIALVGQDLSFPDGRYYAAGSVDGDARVELQEDGGFYLRKPVGATGIGSRLEDGSLRFTKDQQSFEVPGYGGGVVRTSTTFFTFLRWFETITSDVREHTLVLNCTEGGARIPGMEEVPLALLVQECSTESLDLDVTLNAACAEHRPERRREVLATYMTACRDGLERIEGQARECLELATLAVRDPKKLPKLQEVEARMVAELAEVKFFALFDQPEILAAKEAVRTATRVQESLAAARRLYRAVLRGVEVLREPIAAALAGLACPEPD